jgi:flavin-dependent dehydrogenase
VDAVAFERDRFPRRKVCVGFISPAGVNSLEQFGLLDALMAVGAVPVHAAQIRAGGAETTVRLRPPGGLGVSRSALDTLMASRPQILQGHAVMEVTRRDGRFILTGESFEASCRIVIDAAGKLSRFSRRRASSHFGVQYEDAAPRGSVLDFWFFEDGYGGAVAVEGGRSNFCLLVRKERLASWLERPDCLVTGPLAYEKASTGYITIGDAAGMVDPFCGEGIRHALDTGVVAARIIARGMRDGKSYDEIRSEYGLEWERRWARRRALGAGFRYVADQVQGGLKLNKAALSLMRLLWERYSE